MLGVEFAVVLGPRAERSLAQRVAITTDFERATTFSGRRLERSFPLGVEIGLGGHVLAR